MSESVSECIIIEHLTSSRIFTARNLETVI